MKKLLVVLLVFALMVGAFLLGNKIYNKPNSDTMVETEEKDIVADETTIKESQEDITTATENYLLSRNDFYLYKEDWGSGGFYIYRQDGQILNVGTEATFTYDDNGLIVSATDDYFGSGSFKYEFVDGFYIGTAVFDGRDISLRYTYDDNYRLVKREEISGVDIATYEIFYDDDGNVFRTCETDWLKTVNNFGENGIKVEELIYSNDNELIEHKEYDSDGKLCSHRCMDDGEVNEYSEFKKEGDKYIEYIYNNTYPDSYYENYGLPIGSYVEYVERAYDDYGNLIFAEHRTATGFILSTVNYEYKIKEAAF